MVYTALGLHSYLAYKADMVMRRTYNMYEPCSLVLMMVRSVPPPSLCSATVLTASKTFYRCILPNLNSRDPMPLALCSLAFVVGSFSSRFSSSRSITHGSNESTRNAEYQWNIAVLHTHQVWRSSMARLRGLYLLEPND